MTTFMEKITLLAACVFVILLPSSLVSSATLIKTPHSTIQTANQTVEYQCTLNGTQDDVNNSKITWSRPVLGKSYNTDVPENGDSNAKIAVVKKVTKLISTLRIARMPLYEHTQAYYCNAKPPSVARVNQHSFSVTVFKEKAIPEIVPIATLEPAQFRETIQLNCSVKYENDKLNADDYNLKLTWKKGGKIKPYVEKTAKYETGEHTVTLQYSLVITSSDDGGTYVCGMELQRVINNAPQLTKSSAVDLQILPYLTGPERKEVSYEAGSDGTLTCDVVGSPITFEWRDKNDKLIHNGSHSRFRVINHTLSIDNIDYKDRQEYKCLGIGVNVTVTQFITLRVKDPLAPLWPFIGILVEAAIVAAIIVLSELYKKRKQDETEGAASGTEATDQPSTSQT